MAGPIAAISIARRRLNSSQGESTMMNRNWLPFGLISDSSYVLAEEAGMDITLEGLVRPCPGSDDEGKSYRARARNKIRQSSGVECEFGGFSSSAKRARRRSRRPAPPSTIRRSSPSRLACKCSITGTAGGKHN